MNTFSSFFLCFRNPVARRCGLSVSLAIASLLNGCGKSPSVGPGAPTVEFVTLEQKNVPIYREWVGTLSGDVNANISAQVTGYLTNRNYIEGDNVTNGQVLFQIDSATYQTTLANAKAQLAQALAMKAKTKLDVDRYTPLARTDAISQQELDNATQADQSASAQVDAARAMVMQADLNLGFTTIRSPIDGMAGLAAAQIGDLISPSSGPLTTVSKIDPIRANFAVAEQLVYRTLERRAASGQSSETEIPLELTLASGDIYPDKGSIRFTGNQVDVKTGTIEVVGEFPNRRHVLLPGMFARVRAMVAVQTNALLVPQRAVANLQGRQFVAVIGVDDKINVRPVTVGETISNQWIIQAPGLKAGDRIVAEGIQKVRDGAVVKPVPFGTMEAQKE